MVVFGCGKEERGPNFTEVDSFVTQHERVLDQQILAQEATYQVASGLSGWRQLPNAGCGSHPAEWHL